MDSPLISVIIPVYNRTTFVQKAVDSVFAQTYKNYEILLVDDGSNKLTREVLAKYHHSKIKVFSQRHRGVSAARNLGIQQAVGDYLAFLDSDDLWLPEKLAKQLRFFQENPACLINQTDEIWIRHGRRVNPKIKHQKQNGLFLEAALNLCLVTTSSVVCRRELFTTVGLFDERLPACEDYDFYLRVLAKKIPINLLPEPLVIRFAGHQGQLSAKYPAMDRFRIKTLRKLLAGNPSQKQAIKTVLLKKLTILSQGAFKRHKFWRGYYYLLLKSFYQKF